MLLPAVSGGAPLSPLRVVTVVYFPVRFRLLFSIYKIRSLSAREIFKTTHLYNRLSI